MNLSGKFEKYPYFAKLSVPGGTYRGVGEEVPSFQDSFQDSTLWVANAKVPADVIHDLLSKKLDSSRCSGTAFPRAW